MLRRERWVGHVESIREKYTCRVLVRKPDQERPLGKSSPEYENS
jgi:hypothetical protein